MGLKENPGSHSMVGSMAFFFYSWVVVLCGLVCWYTVWTVIGWAEYEFRVTWRIFFLFIRSGNFLESNWIFFYWLGKYLNKNSPLMSLMDLLTFFFAPYGVSRLFHSFHLVKQRPGGFEIALLYP
jgi:hypothetical protein